MKTYPSTAFSSASGDLEHILYNGLDTCLTHEIFTRLLPELNANTRRVYDLERDLLGPALEMSWRGILVDLQRRDAQIAELEELGELLQSFLSRLAYICWRRPLNPRSTQQLVAFFYEALRLPPIISSQKGVKAARMDRETLEKLSETYFITRPFVSLILAIRDNAKTIEFLRTGLHPDGRFRYSLNPSGTDTGRWSSSSDAFGKGRNFQNIQPSLRNMLVADAGYKLCSIDKEQAEARGVGAYAYYVTGIPTYLDACESGDLHTNVARLIWRSVVDRASADQLFYREFSYRDMAKRGGHGTNYLGTAFTMARHLKVQVAVIAEFQRNYFGEFPEIQTWHQWTAQQLALTHKLTTLRGRERTFWARPDDDTTLRKAVAYQPQSLNVDDLDEGLLAAWRDPALRHIHWVGQVHDSIVFQYPEELEAFTVSRVLSHLSTSIQIRPLPSWAPPRYLSVPNEASVGWNLSKFSPKDNPDPDALVKYKGADNRVRQRPATPSAASLLAEPLRRVSTRRDLIRHIQAMGGD